MGVGQKGERLATISKYDCPGEEMENKGPNVQVSVMQNLKKRIPRRRGEHGGRRERCCKPAEKGDIKIDVNA